MSPEPPFLRLVATARSTVSRRPAVRTKAAGRCVRDHPGYSPRTGTPRRSDVQLTRLEEPADDAEQREELRQAELDLMRQREKVTARRRRLPPGTRVQVQDDAFLECPPLVADGDEPVTTVRLSRLFTSADRVDY